MLASSAFSQEKPFEFHAKVLQTIPSTKELYVNVFSLQAIPGSQGTIGAGGFVKRPQSWQPTDKFALLIGYQKIIADGDVIAVMAKKGEVVTRTGTDGVPHNLNTYIFVSEMPSGKK